MTTLGIFENFLDDPVMVESDLKSDKMDLLSTSIQESGLFNGDNEVIVVTDAIWFKRVASDSCLLTKQCNYFFRIGDESAV